MADAELTSRNVLEGKGVLLENLVIALLGTSVNFFLAMLFISK